MRERLVTEGTSNQHRRDANKSRPDSGRARPDRQRRIRQQGIIRDGDQSIISAAALGGPGYWRSFVFLGT